MERIVLLWAAGPQSQAIEINRSSNPLSMGLKVGVKHRFRIINITHNYLARVILRAENGPVQWRAIAKDGADLPPDQAAVRTARQNIGVGETYDFEYEPATVGELCLEVARPGVNGTITAVWCESLGRRSLSPSLRVISRHATLQAYERRNLCRRSRGA